MSKSLSRLHTVSDPTPKNFLLTTSVSGFFRMTRTPKGVGVPYPFSTPGTVHAHFYLFLEVCL